jgi:chaperonin GroEL (HSP60 family)
VRESVFVCVCVCVCVSSRMRCNKVVGIRCDYELYLPHCPCICTLHYTHTYTLHYTTLHSHVYTTHSHTHALTQGDDEGNEQFSKGLLGSCAEVTEEALGDGELLYFRQCAAKVRLCVCLCVCDYVFVCTSMYMSMYNNYKHTHTLSISLFTHTHSPQAAQTIILRGANDYLLDEVDRSLHDCLCVVKRTMER